MVERATRLRRSSGEREGSPLPDTISMLAPRKPLTGIECLRAPCPLDGGTQDQRICCTAI